MSRLIDLITIVEDMDGDDLTFSELKEVIDGFYQILLWCDYPKKEQLHLYRAINFVALAKTELQICEED